MQTVKIGIGYISARPIQIGKARLLAARPHVTACKTGWFHRAKGGALQGHGQAYAHPRRLDIIKNMHGIKLLILPQRACKRFRQAVLRRLPDAQGRKNCIATPSINDRRITIWPFCMWSDKRWLSLFGPRPDRALSTGLRPLCDQCIR